MNTRTELLPHQQQAVDKLIPLRVGALFMEMGTGKSRTAIELIVRRQSRVWNVVWFCPVSLKRTVQHEILKHTDAEREDINVFGDKTTAQSMPDVDWHIVGIESMSASKRVITAANSIIHAQSAVIVDESSYIKGHRSARTCWITDIAKRARYRLILTGTPVSQGVEDLFSQMRFLSPRILGYRSFYSFSRNHLEYSDKYPGMIVQAHNTKYLAAKIQPYVYQVTKEECLELPDKTYRSTHLHMTEEQRAAYEEAKEEIFELYLAYEDLSSYMIFQLFNVLQQIVCGFWNRATGLDKPEFISLPHNRLHALGKEIERAGDEKVIIWAKFRHDIKSISSFLEKRYGPGCAAQYHGDLKEADRHRQIESFREGARFLVATPSCGGHGLTINEANHVIFYNNSFKYAERLQAEDRCHRIGQKEQVLYTDLICQGAIDERIQNALAGKGDAVQEFKNEVDKIKNKTEGRGQVEGLIKSL